MGNDVRPAEAEAEEDIDVVDERGDKEDRERGESVRGEELCAVVLMFEKGVLTGDRRTAVRGGNGCG